MSPIPPDGQAPVLVRATEAETLAGDPGGVITLLAAPGVDADVLFVFAPGVERFEHYRLLDRVHRGDGSWQEISESQQRFDSHYVDSEIRQQTRNERGAS